MNAWLTPLIMALTVIISAAGAYLGFRIQFERFLAKDTEREKHWMRWQETLTRDVEQLKIERNFHGRVGQCEEFIAELRDWKHEVVEPYIRAHGTLKDRVDRMERKP